MFQQEYSVRSMADAAPDKRAQFIRRTYTHLALALLAFVGLEAVLINTPAVVNAAGAILGAHQFAWAGVIGALGLVSWFTRSMVRGASKGVQYLGLGIYVVAQALMFVPLIMIAMYYAGPGLLAQAGIMTGLLFAGLTATVFITRSDFSFLASIVSIGGMIAMGLIFCAIFFGLSLGMWFSVGMIALMGAAILYDTSNVLHHYEEDQYVAASLELFASIVIMLWYVIQLLISLRD